MSPTEKRVALFVADELDFGVELEGLRSTEFIYLYGMIDHQFGRLQGIDQGWIAGKTLHSVAHCSQVDDRWHTGEILQQDAAGSECDFFFRLGFTVPRGQSANVCLGHVAAIFGAQQVLQKDP